MLAQWGDSPHIFLSFFLLLSLVHVGHLYAQLCLCLRNCPASPRRPFLHFLCCGCRPCGLAYHRLLSFFEADSYTGIKSTFSLKYCIGE